jgi:thioredoxin reductase (NADPH)
MYNCIILGSGPAGLTAALYLARANLEPVVFEGPVKGGLLTTTTTVENYPGFADGIDGFELTMNFRKGAQKYGTKFFPYTSKSIQRRDDHFLVNTEDQTFATKSIIIATGSTPKRLDVEGYDTFWNKGISTCAVCDGGLPVFNNVPIAVIGGGDSACEEALHMTHFASRVYLIHRRDKLRASNIMCERVLNHPKIEMIWNTEIEKIKGETRISKLVLFNNEKKTKSELDVGGLFVAIGHTPNSSAFKSLLDLDEDSYIVIGKDCSTSQSGTSIPGVFACGDVSDKKYRQAITAAGTGCIAALEAQRYLTH